MRMQAQSPAAGAIHSYVVLAHVPFPWESGPGSLDRHDSATQTPSQRCKTPKGHMVHSMINKRVENRNVRCSHYAALKQFVEM